MAAADRVRLGMRTGVVTASETKELSRLDGGKSDRREVKRFGRARQPHVLAIFSLSNGRPRSLYLFGGVRDLRPPRSHSHRPGPTGRIGQETRQAFKSGGRAKLSCEGIFESVIYGSLHSLKPLKEDLRTSGHGAASEYGSSSSRRRQIEFRSVRVLELQPHRSPRHRPARRGTRTRRWGFTRRSSPHGKV